jgi:serine protease Do
MSSITLKRAVVAIALLGAVAGGYSLRHPFLSQASAVGREESTAVPPAAAAPRAALPAVPIPQVTLPDFSAIVRRYGPAVVNVSVVGTHPAAEEGGAATPMDPQDPFFQFFRRFGAPPRGDSPTHGLGSGFIVSSDGLILTNAHVVDGATDVTVKLTDKREFRAKVVGKDKGTDVAVLRIDARNLPTVTLGDPARTQVGEWVLAIGSPFGFENSATAGIVSGRARSLPDEGYVPFLQTDVPVNPGNSGGPLFNLAGQVVGINSQIYTRSGGYMGLSFAIPIDVAMKVEGQLVAHGKVSRGRLGVTIQPVDQKLAGSFGLKKPQGALVSSVDEDGPAAKAGLEAGDVILALDGKPVEDSSDLPPRVADLGPGARLHLEVWRKGSRREVDVTTVEATDPAARAAREDGAEHGRLGLAVRPLTPEERREAQVKGGVRVESVSGPAAKAGILPGDVVLSVNGTPVTGVDQLRSMVSKVSQVALLVQRGDARIFVPVDVG